MKAKIILNQPLTQERYGLHFEKGKAQTDNEYLIKKLQKKGVTVEVIEENSKEKSLEEMTVPELTKLATEKGIELPKKPKKADIIELLNKQNDAVSNEGTEEDGENSKETENPDESGQEDK